ncbi:MAG: Crp/Fnr family transcriptional regulator [Mariprofundales bacterium]
MNAIPDDWIQHFPQLATIDDDAWHGSAKAAQQMTVPAGTVLFRDGDNARGYVLVIEGAIRVQKMDPDGHEIVLYRVESGQNCMLTTTCLLGQQHYPCEGIAEDTVRLVLIPTTAFERALNGSADFRHFVMHGFGQRIADLMSLIEDVAFGRMDVRIARMLLERSDHGHHALQATHQALAVELGTAREVISRVLKQFERQGMIELGRGVVRVTQPQQLAKKAR